jgi:uncharacterized protein YndB with AHSA1/START domain
MTRVLPASRARVFEACTDPSELAKWWGPRGFTSPSIEIDLRVGGSYRIAMLPPHGEIFCLTGEFTAIDPPARLAGAFATEGRRALHEQGWTDCWERLRAVLAHEATGATGAS